MTANPVVIKVGGALLERHDAMTRLFDSIHAVSAQRTVVLVHGGGPVVEHWMEKLSLPTRKIDGLRVTPDEDMPFICGALAGHSNTTLCAVAAACGLAPVGLSLADGNMVTCTPLDKKYGAVGSVTPADPALLTTLLAGHFVPVISSIGCDQHGRLLNINADQAATVIAKLLRAELLLLSNVDGVLDGNRQLLPVLTASELNALSDSGVVTDGMKVKTDAALDAANALGRAVIIASWDAPVSAILAHQTGTRLLPSDAPTGDVQ
ncbi:acetylglutamate kinase [Alteromonas sp. CYL-A6]|uniref:acetylglutamate kinase n=1 Tax=Alteromonas nitratireducens TaxID=3390813 RepID=UPI0034BD8CC9